MPTLKKLTCHVETGNHAIDEWNTFYLDNLVESYIAVPNKDVPFSIRLTSDDYISSGLSMFVFIDGVHQCNRNRRGLLQPGPKVEPHESNVDFRVRQKEEKVDGNLFIGREWTFKELRKVAAKSKASGQDEEILKSVGEIEVVVLRCKEEDGATSHAAYRVLDKPRTAAGIALQQAGQGVQRSHDTFVTADGASDSVNALRRTLMNAGEKNADDSALGLMGWLGQITAEMFGLTKAMQGLNLDGSKDMPSKRKSSAQSPQKQVVIPQLDGTGHRRMRTAMVVNQYVGKSSSDRSSSSSRSPRSEKAKSRSRKSKSKSRGAKNGDWGGNDNGQDNNQGQNNNSWEQDPDGNNGDDSQNQENNDGGDDWGNYATGDNADGHDDGNNTQDNNAGDWGNNDNTNFDQAPADNNAGGNQSGGNWDNNQPDKRSWNNQQHNSTSGHGGNIQRKPSGDGNSRGSSRKPPQAQDQSAAGGWAGRIKSYWANWNKGEQRAPKLNASTSSIHVAPEGHPAPVPEDIAAQGSLSHQLTLGKGALYSKQLGRPIYEDDFSNPYAVFVFKYRSRDVVQELVNNMYRMKIPRRYRDKPESKSTSRFMGMTKEELFAQLRAAKGQAGYNTDSDLTSSDEGGDKKDDGAPDAGGQGNGGGNIVWGQASAHPASQTGQSGKSNKKRAQPSNASNAGASQNRGNTSRVQPNAPGGSQAGQSRKSNVGSDKAPLQDTTNWNSGGGNTNWNGPASVKSTKSINWGDTTGNPWGTGRASQSGQSNRKSGGGGHDTTNSRAPGGWDENGAGGGGAATNW